MKGISLTYLIYVMISYEHLVGSMWTDQIPLTAHFGGKLRQMRRHDIFGTIYLEFKNVI